MEVPVQSTTTSAGIFQSWSVGFGVVSEWECQCEVQVQICFSPGVWDLESGVALPFRDLRQPMRNITYFVSMA